jgi:hypothetical protein
MRELGLDRRRATATTATLLAAIDPVLTQWRLRPQPTGRSCSKRSTSAWCVALRDATA